MHVNRRVREGAISPGRPGYAERPNCGPSKYAPHSIGEKQDDDDYDPRDDAPAQIKLEDADQPLARSLHPAYLTSRSAA